MSEIIQRLSSMDVRVVHPLFGSYSKFLDRFFKSFPAPSFHVQQDNFKDGSPWLQVVVDNERKRRSAIVPFWISPRFAEYGNNIMAIAQVANALTHKEDVNDALVDRVIGVAPYIELRQDKSSIDPYTGLKKTGEAVNAELTASFLKASGVNELILLEPHSFEAMNYFTKAGIKCLPLTVAPLFADKLSASGSVDDNSAFVALDKGSLQKNLRLLDLLGLDPATHLVVLDKIRSGHNQVASAGLIHGILDGKKAYTFDDIIDSAATLGKTCALFKRDYHCLKVTVMATHGVLSYPARENILGNLGSENIDSLIVTDSLPSVPYSLTDIDRVEIIPVAEIMGLAAKLVMETSIEEAANNPVLKPYVLYPRQKEKVWQQFNNKFIDQDTNFVPSQAGSYISLS